jgi:hypothetical protein
MTFYDLKKLNIKLADFICLLSPLGVVTKIVNNGNKNLVQIEFHDNLLKKNGIQIKEDDYIEDSLIRLYKDSKYGFIINDKIGIIELPYGIEEDSFYIKQLNEKTNKTISKFVRKKFPKDCQIILNKGISIDNIKYTDPNNININSILGHKSINV